MPFGNKTDKLTLTELALQRRANHFILVHEIETKGTWSGGMHNEQADIIEQIEQGGWVLHHSVINGARWQLVFRAAR